jgi:hypothetical protein
MEMEDDDVNDDWGEYRESEDPKNTSNYVSTIRNPSFGGAAATSDLLLNQSLQDVEMNEEQ